MPDSFPPERPGLLKRLWGGGPEKTKTSRLPVNAYGKLPIYKDFISSGLTEPPAREFRAWLDKGFSHRWATDDGCRDAEIPPYNFLMRLPDSRGCAAGCLWGSSDEGGLRKFPFALFLSFPAAHGAADPIAAVEYLGDLERRANELRFLFGPGASLSSFYQAYRGAELDLPIRSREQVARDFRSELAGFSVGDFAESVLGSLAPRAWPQLLDATSAAAGGPGALRLPLGGRLPRQREVEFWLLWLDRQDAKRRRPVTGVLYPQGHNPGRAVFFFRDVQPDDFLLLHPTRSDLPRVHEAIAYVTALPDRPASASRSTPSPTPLPTPGRAAAPSVPAADPLATAAPQGNAGTAETPETAVAAQMRGEAETPIAEAAAAAKTEGPAVAPAGADAPAQGAPLSASPSPPAEGLAEEAPFPEAEIPAEPTSGGRLSQILALDRARPTGSGEPDGGSAPQQSSPSPNAPPSAPPSETGSEPALAAPEAAVAPSDPPASAPPPFQSPAAPPAAASAPPILDAGEAPSAPGIEPARLEPLPPSQSPAAPPAAVASTPPPPGWERPLPSLLES